MFWVNLITVKTLALRVFFFNWRSVAHHTFPFLDSCVYQRSETHSGYMSVSSKQSETLLWDHQAVREVQPVSRVPAFAGQAADTWVKEPSWTWGHDVENNQGAQLTPGTDTADPWPQVSHLGHVQWLDPYQPRPQSSWKRDEWSPNVPCLIFRPMKLWALQKSCCFEKNAIGPQIPKTEAWV